MPRHAEISSHLRPVTGTLHEAESSRPDCHACGKVERFHQTLKLFLSRQARAATIADLQAQVDRFAAYYNEIRPHRAKAHMTPRAAFDSRDKARPHNRSQAISRELRVRHDKIDGHGKVTIRYKSKLHHIGLGRALKRTRVILLVEGRDIRVLSEDGELLRQLILNPNRDYQPQDQS